MSDALFLPRELFAPATPTAVVTEQAAAHPRRGVNFVSGEAVAADLLQGLAPTSTAPAVPAERRRKPRPAAARGVDLFLA
jgi:4'-phosphopantetheinyl transferase EntD